MDKKTGSPAGTADWADARSTLIHAGIVLSGAGVTWLIDYGHEHFGTLAGVAVASTVLKFLQRVFTDSRHV